MFIEKILVNIETKIAERLIVKTEFSLQNVKGLNLGFWRLKLSEVTKFDLLLVAVLQALLCQSITFANQKILVP